MCSKDRRSSGIVIIAFDFDFIDFVFVDFDFVVFVVFLLCVFLIRSL